MSASLSFPANAIAAPALWGKLPDDRGAAGVVHHFCQDQEIFGDGDPAEFFYKVISGTVRTCKFLDDGRRHLEEFHSAGDVFGFEAGRTYSLSAEAVRQCSVVAYRRRSADTDDHLRSLVLNSMMRQMDRARHHMLLLGAKSAHEKVAGFLLDLASREPNPKIVNLAMTRQDMGDYLGLTIETVSRMMSLLERQGLIELASARQVKLKDTAALRALDI